MELVRTKRSGSWIRRSYRRRKDLYSLSGFVLSKQPGACIKRPGECQVHLLGSRRIPRCMILPGPHVSVEDARSGHTSHPRALGAHAPRVHQKRQHLRKQLDVPSRKAWQPLHRPCGARASDLSAPSSVGCHLRRMPQCRTTWDSRLNAIGWPDVADNCTRACSKKKRITTLVHGGCMWYVWVCVHGWMSVWCASHLMCAIALHSVAMHCAAQHCNA